MIKKFMLVAAMLISAKVFAQDQPCAKALQESTKKMDQIQLAGQLVNYGYDTKSALPIIQAIKIYQDLNVIEANDGRKPKTKADEEVTVNITKEDQPVRNMSQLFDDATAFANGDKNLLALIDGCKKASTQRDPVGGPIDRFFRIPARSTQEWVVTLHGGERTGIVVSGDGTTDLDVYIYDYNGNLIVSDITYGDQCSFFVDVFYTSDFTIRVVNRGYVYNDYELFVF